MKRSILVISCMVVIISCVSVNKVTQKDEEYLPLEFLDAIRENDLGRVRSYISSGIDVSSRSQNRELAILVAARYCGNPLVVKELIDAGANLSSRDIDHSTPILIASSYNKYDVIKILLDAGAKWSDRNEAGYFPIVAAAAYNPDPKVIDLLLQYGSNINIEYEFGKTPIFAAIEKHNNLEVIKKILDCGADVNHRSTSGNVFINAAGWVSDSSVLKMLVDYGAEVSLEDYYGNDAMRRVLFNRKADKIELFDYLLSLGFDINHKDDQGKTVFTTAVSIGEDPAVLEYLLEHGSDINSIDNAGWVPIFYAIQNKNIYLFVFLLNHGCRTDVVDRSGKGIRDYLNTYIPELVIQDSKITI